MKKLIYLIGVMSVLAGFSAPASTLNEWNFYSDPAGRTLSNAINSAGSARFSPGGAGILETDGRGTLLCTYSDPGTNGIWTNGITLDAATSNLTTGTFFLRYDFTYDLNSINNHNGTLLGFSFADATGLKVAGAALQYNMSITPTPTNLVVTSVADLGTNFIGHISIITKVDMAAQKLSVWYDLSGTGSFSAESSPQASDIAVNLPSINNLRLQATGDFRPAGSDDYAKISLLRMSDNFSDAAAAGAPVPPAAKYSNEWTFERDISGRQLSDAVNSGTNVPLAQFSAGFSNTVFTTNRALICVGNDAGTGGAWTNGAILDAALPAATSGVHYLRYDLNYDLSATNNDSGTMMGVYFTGSSGDKAAGLVLGYDTGTLASEAPANRTLTVVTNSLPRTGKLTAVAEVDLNLHRLKVWYDLSGSNTINTNSPAISTDITLSSITNLRFHATGDFRPDGSSNFVSVDNIRHTANLRDIIDPPANLSPPAHLTINVSNSSNGSMESGETNLVSVVIRNSGGRSATDVTSTLTQNGTPGSFTIISNNAPVPLEAGSSTTNFYALIAHANGTYSFTIRASSQETNSIATNLTVTVGSHISYVGNSIEEVSSGIISNKYEPGETIRITVTNVNDGVRTVTNIVNTLSANQKYFSIFPSSATYSSLAVGESTSTVYAVVISNTTPAGIYTFSVTNRAGSMVWADSFTLEVFSAAIPSVTNSLLIEVVSGEVTNKTLTLNNSGNVSTAFTVSDDGKRPINSYEVHMITETMVPFIDSAAFDQPDPASSFTNWSGSSTVPMSIGFAFPLDGVFYTNFSVSAYGAIALGGNTVSNNPTGILPFGTNNVVVAPFWGSIAVDQSTVRYKKESDRLVVSWGNGTGHEFQAWLYKSGQIHYLYDLGFSGTGAIGIQTKSHFVQPTLGYLGSGQTGFLFTLGSWITYAPANGTVSGTGSTPVTFTADATGQSAGTNTFNAYITWGDGSTNPVAVTVKVLNAIRGLTVTPTNVSFSGSAGFITQTNVSLINTGTVAFAYTITDVNSQTNGYKWTNNATYSWVNATDLTSNQSGWIPIGFPFSFYGNVYTQFIVSINGAIGLGSSAQTNTDKIIAPYYGKLSLDSNASIRSTGDANQMVITWENIAQTNGSRDLTFQAVLNRDGSILFQYKTLSNSNVWPSTSIFLQDATNRFTVASLSNQWTTLTTTNYTTTTSNLYDTVVVITNSTNIVVKYANSVSNQAIRFVPAGGRVIISASPASGTIPVGGTHIITLSGDARSLTSNGVNSVTNSTTFRISYIGGTNSLPVRFIATNSVETAYSAALSAGIAGVDYFAASVSQSADGSRTITWPAANDPLTRTYKVWYTLDLQQDFQWLATVENGTTYMDTAHADAKVIYYKVTVQ